MTAQEGGGNPSPGMGPTELSEEQIQQALATGENLRMQLAQLDEQQAYLSELLADTTRSRKALEALENLGEGEEVLLPIGAGNFVRARVSDAGKVLTNLGSGLHLEAGIPTALERLKEREEGLGKTQDRLQEEATRVSAQLQQVSGILQQFRGGL